MPKVSWTELQGLQVTAEVTVQQVAGELVIAHVRAALPLHTYTTLES